MLTLTQRLQGSRENVTVSDTLPLVAEERVRTRHRFETREGRVFILNLPRGTTVQAGDLLQAETGEIVEIVAKPEPVLTVLAPPLPLLKAAYHLGNRHVPLEITGTYLRLSPDRVLQEMLSQLGLEVREEVAPFHPETGAYGHHH